MKFLFNIVRLPLDLIYVQWDFLRAVRVYLRRKYAGKMRPCAFCFDPANPKAHPRKCPAALKYGNLWVFRSICPCVKKAGTTPGWAAPHCIAKSNFKYTPRHAIIALVGLVFWSGVGYGAYRHLGGPADSTEALPDRPDQWDPTRKADPAKAAAYIERARELFEAEDYEAARIEYQNAKKYDKDNPDVHLALANCNLYLQNWVEALEEYKRTVRLRPDSQEAHQRLAELNFAIGHHEEAIVHGERAKQLEATNVVMRLFLAKAYYVTQEKERAREEAVDAAKLAAGDAELLSATASLFVVMNDLERAEDIFRRALAVADDHVRSYVGLAEVVRFRGRPDEADDLLDTAGRLDADNPMIKVQRAELAVGRYDVGQAIATYRELVEAAPDHYPAIARLAELLITTGRVDEGYRMAMELTESGRRELAIPGFFVITRMYMLQGMHSDAVAAARKILALDKDNTKARMLLARNLHNSGMYKNAINEFKELVYQVPDAVDIRIDMARAYAELGDHEGVESVYEDALAQFPDSIAVLLDIGNYRFYRGDFERATVNYEAVLALEPDNVAAANNLAMLWLAEDRRVDEAYSVVTGLVARVPDNPLLSDTLGWAHYRRGEFEKAVDVLRVTAQQLPYSPEVHYHLGAALLETGAVDAGRRELHTALALSSNFVDVASARELLAETEEP